MEKGEVFCEGKTKILHNVVEDDRVLIQEFKNDVTAFNGEKHEVIENKGFYCNKISSKAFEYLERNGVNTHYISKYDNNSMLVKKTKPILLEVVVRQYPTGSLVKRLGLDKPGHTRSQGSSVWITKQISKNKFVNDEIIELFYKNDELGDPLINDDHACAYITDCQTLDRIKQITPIAFKNVRQFFKSLGFRLMDIKFEFGLADNGDILLIDDITPEGCRLEDFVSFERFDKDVFRYGVKGLRKYEPMKSIDLETFIGHKFNNFGEVLQSVSHRIEYQNGGGLLATCYDKYICEF